MVMDPGKFPTRGRVYEKGTPRGYSGSDSAWEQIGRRPAVPTNNAEANWSGGRTTDRTGKVGRAEKLLKDKAQLAGAVETEPYSGDRLRPQGIYPASLRRTDHDGSWPGSFAHGPFSASSADRRNGRWRNQLHARATRTQSPNG